MPELKVLDLFSGIRSGASPSDSSAPACEPSPSAKSILSVERLSPKTFQASPATSISENSQQTDWLPMESKLTSSAADSPARTSVLPVRELVLQAHGAGSGANITDLLASYDRNTSSWRTSQLCLVEGLERYSETWPRSGMTRNGIAYRLPTLVPLTEETEYGSFPTPNVPNGGRSIKHSDEWRGKTPYHKGKKVQVDLAAAVRMWPTPRNNTGPSMDARHLSLDGAVRLFHTPRTTPRTAREYDGMSPLGIGGLNPTWVEWLMGFPAEWTVLSPSEMPSSRKSRKSSGEQS